MDELIQEPRHFCALGGQQTVTSIERAIPIVHEGPGCCAKITQGMSGGGGNQGTGYVGGDAIPCSNMVEADIVFGGEEKLRTLIESTFKIMDGDFFVVLTGCTSDLIADDVMNVVKDFRDQGAPIVCAETGGFQGDAYFGHERVLESIIEQYLEPKALELKAEVERGLVNVFASVPGHDIFWEGDLQEIRRLLKLLGLEANILFGRASGGKSAIDRIPSAEFNLVASPHVGLNAAKLLEKKFGTPYLHVNSIPIGPTATGEFLKAVAAFSGRDSASVERMADEIESEFYHYLLRAGDFLNESRFNLPKRFYNINDSNSVLAFSKFLVNDLGFLPAHQFITENVPEVYAQSVASYFEELAPGISSPVTFSQDGEVIHRTIKSNVYNVPSLVLGSIWDIDIADEIGASFVTVGLPANDRLILDRSYVGCHGSLALVEDIYSRILTKARS
jgi:nitrogenase molybdenum-iron protein beta chain